MKNKLPKVIMLSTSRKTRAGIAPVLKMYETTPFWNEMHCKWLQTHRDGNNLRKIGYFVSAFVQYLFFLPFFDIVHIHLAQGISIKRKKIFFEIAKLMKKKTVIHFHPPGVYVLDKPSDFNMYVALFSRADVVVVLSEQYKKIMTERLKINASKVVILYNPCPIVQRESGEKDKYILFAASIIQRKGYSDLLHAFAKISSKYPDWKVIFMGKGEVGNGEKIAKELNIVEKIKFTGWVTDKQKNDYFKSAAIYCLPSYGEGFPMGILDAWAYGVPVVTTPVGGIPDIVKDGINGLLCNPGDQDALAEKLELLMNDNSLSEKLCVESDKYVYGAFDLNYVVNQLQEIYINLNSQKYFRV